MDDLFADFFWLKTEKQSNSLSIERINDILKNFMKNFTTYLSTAPVIALIWFTFTAGLLIEINRFFPDPLVFSF